MPILLILIGFALIIYAGISIRKDKDISVKDQKIEKSFNKAFDESKKNMSSDRLELGILRRDIGESLTELQMDIESIKKFINMPQYIEKKDKKDDNKNSETMSKSEKIKRLIASGMNDDDICIRLGVDKGEVLLVRGLLKK